MFGRTGAVQKKGPTGHRMSDSSSITILYLLRRVVIAKSVSSLCDFTFLFDLDFR